MKLKGKAWTFGDNVNTDDIIPARYLNTTDPGELIRYCMEGVDKDFAAKVKKGDVIVAGENFGCGSSREHAPLAIKGCGIACVIAESFARIFYRNCINIGLPILECRGAKKINQADQIEIDISEGLVNDLTAGLSFNSQPFAEFMKNIIQAGGLMEWIRRKPDA
ncbi:MAG: 3-isopropylmalate dehydratase small subunit [Candidatus Omnitrophota bacterium]|nr:3-isopropylmalate dehydratase small subunit [Candidatus Omnitrophota bacterium]